MDPQGIALEGVRRHDEWGRIEKAIGRTDAVFLRVERAATEDAAAGGPAQEPDLPEAAARLLELLGGCRTLEECLPDLPCGRFGAAEALALLKDRGLVAEATPEEIAARARAAEKKGRLDEAERLYRLALRIGREALSLRERLADLLERAARLEERAARESAALATFALFFALAGATAARETFATLALCEWTAHALHPVAGADGRALCEGFLSVARAYPGTFAGAEARRHAGAALAGEIARIDILLAEGAASKAGARLERLEGLSLSEIPAEYAASVLRARRRLAGSLALVPARAAGTPAGGKGEAAEAHAPERQRAP